MLKDLINKLAGKSQGNNTPSMNRDVYLEQGNPIVEWINNQLPDFEVSTIFDIGACEGLDSILYERGFPTSTVFSFEPVPSNFSRLEGNLVHYGSQRIKPFKLALSNENGSAQFHVSTSDSSTATDEWDTGNKSSSLMPPDEHEKLFPSIKFETSIEVETKTMESFCSENSIHSIDLIHMDVQGAELMVLEGAGNTIEKIGLIWLEVSNVSLYKDQPLKREIEDYMKKNGFSLMKDQVGKLYGDQLWANETYLNSKV